MRGCAGYKKSLYFLVSQQILDQISIMLVQLFLSFTEDYRKDWKELSFLQKWIPRNWTPVSIISFYCIDPKWIWNLLSFASTVSFLNSSIWKYWLSFFCLPLSLIPPSPLIFPQDVQIVSTDENQVFLALQEWYQSDTYNLYQSDPQGVYYSIVLENVRSTKQPEENVLIDILEVRWYEGRGVLKMKCVE